jgi:hypothetical protein
MMLDDVGSPVGRIRDGLAIRRTIGTIAPHGLSSISPNRDSNQAIKAA